MKSSLVATLFLFLFSSVIVLADAAAQGVTQLPQFNGYESGFADPETQGTSKTKKKDLSYEDSLSARSPSQLLRQMREALIKADTAEATKGIMDRLHQLLGEQFEADIQKRVKELDAIKARVKQMEALLDKRVEAKERIVELRVLTLVNEAKGLGWTDSSRDRPQRNDSKNSFNLGNPYDGNWPVRLDPFLDDLGDAAPFD